MRYRSPPSQQWALLGAGKGGRLAAGAGLETWNLGKKEILFPLLSICVFVLLTLVTVDREVVKVWPPTSSLMILESPIALDAAPC